MELEKIDWKQIKNRLFAAAATSRCKRLQVASMSIEDLVWTTNGTEPGTYCNGKLGNCGCLHAEKKLLGRTNVPIERLAITHSPCLVCSKIIFAKGVKEVYFFNEYRTKSGIKYLIARGVKCVKLN